MNICICGGGSLGHVIAGKIASYGEHVSILTRRPEQWRKSLIIDDCKGESISGKIQNISDNPSDIIPLAGIRQQNSNLSANISMIVRVIFWPPDTVAKVSQTRTFLFRIMKHPLLRL